MSAGQAAGQLEHCSSSRIPDQIISQQLQAGASLTADAPGETPRNKAARAEEKQQQRPQRRRVQPMPLVYQQFVLIVLTMSHEHQVHADGSAVCSDSELLSLRATYFDHL